MCLIIQHDPSKTALTDVEIRDVYSRNRDGFGSMHVENSAVVVTKAVPRDVNHAIELYRVAASKPGVVVVHWRMATHGAVVDSLAHPFELVAGELALVHNGVLGGEWCPDRDGIESDTSRLAASLSSWFQEHGTQHRRDPGLISWLDQQVRGSAVVTMAVGADGLAEVHRHGNAGLMHANRWYSNTYAWTRPRPVYTSTPSPAGPQQTNWWNTPEWSADTRRKQNSWLSSPEWSADTRKAVTEYKNKRRRAKTWSRIQGYAKGAKVALTADIGSFETPGPLVYGNLERIANWLMDRASVVGSAWFLGDPNPDIVHYGITETVATLNEIMPKGFAIRFRYSDNRGSLSVVESWEVADDDASDDAEYQRAWESALRTMT